MSEGSVDRVDVRAGGGRDYEVVVGAGLLDRVGPEALEAASAVRRWAIISDDTVDALYGDQVERSFAGSDRAVERLTFPAGEVHKVRGTWVDLTDRLLQAGLGRDGGIVALGGGVTGDLAGFVAATYMRGIPVVQVPTSIVAMVDSAVGGKTGVDTVHGKNLVGAFHPPVRVVVDPVAVRTLTREQRSEGLAEAAKHGAIVDEDYARSVQSAAEALLAGQVEAVAPAVLRSIQIKADVVSRDEREGGLREILNFGHTVGHAVEAASDYQLSHGAAVAIGMVCEARLGEALGQTATGTAEQLRGVLEALELPVAPPVDTSPDVLLGFMRADKKVRDGQTRVVLLESMGRVAHDGSSWSHRVDAEWLRELLAPA